MRLTTIHSPRYPAWLAVATGLAAGCAATPPTARLGWFETNRLNAPAAEQAGLWAAATSAPGEIHLLAPINSTVSFGVVVVAGEEPIDGPGLSVRPFSSIAGRLDAQALRIYRVYEVSIHDLPGWHIRSIPPTERVSSVSDVLVPIEALRGGMPESLVPGTRYVFWVDASIPKATNAGVYSTTLDLEAGGEVLAAIPVTIEVPELVLPDEARPMILCDLDHRALFRHAANIGNTSAAPALDDWSRDPRRDQLNRQLLDAMRMLREHGLTPVLSDLRPVGKITRRGALALDWTQYDALVAPCLDGRAFTDRNGLDAWPIPSAPSSRGLMVSSRAEQQESNRAVREYLGQCIRHFVDKGWLGPAYLLLPRESLRTAVSDEAARDLAIAAHSINPALRVLAHDPPQDLEPFGWEGYHKTRLDEVVDGWLTPAQFFDPTVMRGERDRGRATWLGLDDPPYTGSLNVAAPAAYVRSLTWITAHLGAPTLAIGTVNPWPSDAGASTPDACVAFDPNTLIYPGRPFGLDEPVASVRLKRLRDSVTDARLRALLHKRGLDHIAAALGNVLVAYAGTEAYRTHYANGRPIGWVGNIGQYDRAREVMIESLRLDHAAAAPTSAALLERDTTWQRLMRDAEHLRLEVDGCNVRSTSEGASWSAELSCAVTITNRRRTPCTGTIRFGRMPTGWHERESSRSVGPLGPNQSSRILLTADAGVFPSMPNGHVDVPVELVTNAGHISESDARVAFVTALPRGDQIVIDGDLGDWPLGSVNTLGGFRLITRNGTDTETRPRADTVAFVLLGDNGLCVGINTRYAIGASPPARARNTVRYDGLLPVGEDLVEVLIDPYNSGTRAPADLYHIVVKPTGVYLTERGVDIDPPVGKRAPWAADIEVASQLGGGRWTVEMRIPWAAFEGIARSNRVWALNVTRFDESNLEYSTWSGATGTAYDPLSLGSLFLPALPARHR